jgi:hypothetical protein
MSDTPGFVYVLLNSSMPGLVKVGLTTRDPEERAAELASATGVPSPFIVAYRRWVSDCQTVEAFIHERLAILGHRHSLAREFFNAPPWVVIDLLASLPDLSGSDSPSPSVSPEGADSRPWKSLWEEAEALQYGRGDTITDVRRAMQKYSSAAKLGCPAAYSRLAELTFEGARSEGQTEKALDWIYKGIERGHYVCHFTLAKLHSGSQSRVGVRKALNAFFRERAERIDADTEERLHVTFDLHHLIASETASFLELDSNAAGQLRELSSTLLKYYDDSIAFFVDRGNESLVEQYSSARRLIEEVAYLS